MDQVVPRGALVALIVNLTFINSLFVLNLLNYYLLELLIFCFGLAQCSFFVDIYLGVFHEFKMLRFSI
jgi:hypothetical protein